VSAGTEAGTAVRFIHHIRQLQQNASHPATDREREIDEAYLATAEGGTVGEDKMSSVHPAQTPICRLGVAGCPCTQLNSYDHVLL